jgi:DNA-binding MarR family transcriptional regulator
MAADESAGMADPGEILSRLEDMRISAHLLSKLKYAQATARTALAVEFDKIGLTTPQFLALAAVDENHDISSAELARRSFCSAQAMTAIVARLEGSGLISRTPAARGGRSLSMQLTPKGEALLDRAREHAYAIERYVYELLGADAYGSLLDSLDRITDALSQETTVTKTSPWDAYVRPTDA